MDYVRMEFAVSFWVVGKLVCVCNLDTCSRLLMYKCSLSGQDSFFLGFHPVRSGICLVVAMLQEYIGAPERRKLHGSAAGCSLSDSDRCEHRY